MSKLLLTFQVTGSNPFLADTGDLILRDEHKEVMRSTGFSGGMNSPAKSAPLPSGDYRIRLDIHRVATTYPADGDSERAMHAWYGIEKIDTPAWQFEWGHYRAHLNEPNSHLPQAYRGNFLFGKVRTDDHTHGCICERSEKILTHLLSIQPCHVVVRVKR